MDYFRALAHEKASEKSVIIFHITRIELFRIYKISSLEIFKTYGNNVDTKILFIFFPFLFMLLIKLLEESLQKMLPSNENIPDAAPSAILLSSGSTHL